MEAPTPPQVTAGGKQRLCQSAARERLSLDLNRCRPAPASRKAVSRPSACPLRLEKFEPLPPRKGSRRRKPGPYLPILRTTTTIQKSFCLFLRQAPHKIAIILHSLLEVASRPPARLDERDRSSIRRVDHAKRQAFRPPWSTHRDPGWRSCPGGPCAPDERLRRRSVLLHGAW